MLLLRNTALTSDHHNDLSMLRDHRVHFRMRMDLRSTHAYCALPALGTRKFEDIA